MTPPSSKEHGVALRQRCIGFFLGSAGWRVLVTSPLSQDPGSSDSALYMLHSRVCKEGCVGGLRRSREMRGRNVSE